jgi:hypothetical protein
MFLNSLNKQVQRLLDLDIESLGTSLDVSKLLTLTGNSYFLQNTTEALSTTHQIETIELIEPGCNLLEHQGFKSLKSQRCTLP